MFYSRTQSNQSWDENQRLVFIWATSPSFPKNHNRARSSLEMMQRLARLDALDLLEDPRPNSSVLKLCGSEKAADLCYWHPHLNYRRRVNEARKLPIRSTRSSKAHAGRKSNLRGHTLLPGHPGVVTLAAACSSSTPSPITTYTTFLPNLCIMRSKQLSLPAT